MIENGSFYALPFWKRYGLIRRIKRLYGSLVGPLSPAVLRAALAGAAAILIGACAPGGGDDGPVADNPSFAGGVQNPFGLEQVTSLGAPAFAAIDEDGDADLFAGAGGEGFGQPVLYSVNIGTPISPSFSGLSPYPGLASYNLYGIVPVLAPIDGDADFDLFVGHLADGFPTLEYYRNDSGTFVSDDTIPGLPSGGGPDDRALTATVVDIDGDGDLDAFVSRTWYYSAYEIYYGTEIRYYENTGTRASPAFTNRGPSFGLDSPSDYGAFPTFVDIDADGDFDAFVGDNDGNIQFFRNRYTYRSRLRRAAGQSLRPDRRCQPPRGPRLRGHRRGWGLRPVRRRRHREHLVLREHEPVGCRCGLGAARFRVPHTPAS